MVSFETNKGGATMQKRLDDLYHGFCNKQDFTNRMLSVEESNKDFKKAFRRTRGAFGNTDMLFGAGY